jgi:Zn-dependent M28 family amino/carboxypeptidase
MSEPLLDNLQSHVKEIARPRDPYLANGGHFYVQEYIRQELAQWGEVEVHEFQVRAKTHQNFILDLPNDTNTQKPPILIGAHYDAVIGSPGADDNATGVAVLLELARIFAAEPGHYPLRLVAFDLEEYNLLGSFCYASKLRRQKQRLRLTISLEMLGYCDHNPGSQQYPPGLNFFYPSKGDFIALIGNLPTLLDLIHISHHVKNTGIPCEWLPVAIRGLLLPDTRRSDHAPFWDNGYSAIMVTDTANLRNPHYHQPSDTIDTVDFEFLTGVLKGLATGIRNIR